MTGLCLTSVWNLLISLLFDVIWGWVVCTIVILVGLGELDCLLFPVLGCDGSWRVIWHYLARQSLDFSGRFSSIGACKGLSTFLRRSNWIDAVYHLIRLVGYLLVLCSGILMMFRFDRNTVFGQTKLVQIAFLCIMIWSTLSRLIICMRICQLAFFTMNWL